MNAARPDRRLSFRALLLAYLLAGAIAVVAATIARHLTPRLHPVLAAGAADVLATVVVFCFSAAFDNSSIYDPYWSVAPVPIAFFWVLATGACLPLWPALTAGGRAVGVLDLTAAVVTVGAIGIEAVSDRQLRRFLARPRSARRLIDEGLWALVRHPNYLGEVLFWWGLWLFGLAANPSWWWTIVGPAAITLMFLLVSVPMMDRHLRGRRRSYDSPRRTTASSTMAR
ncbi:MAG: DUF1295 domain-containing protein [Spirochaetes bacterium]|nr:DUF1295 domain-containing protein [Spirochaetota bacterium]